MSAKRYVAPPLHYDWFTFRWCALIGAALFVVFGALGIPGWMAYEVRRQRNVVSYLEDQGAEFTFTDSNSKLPEWLDTRYFDRVISVTCRSESSVSDFTQLGEMKNLRVLDLVFAPVNSVETLADLEQLHELDLGQTDVTDISPIAELRELRKLDLFLVEIDDVSALERLVELEWLDLRDTKVSDISALSKLERVTKLDLSRTKVSDITPLKGMRKLETLDLSESQVVDISPLVEAKLLRKLDLTSTQVSDLSPVVEMRNLESLTVGASADLSVLKQAAHLKELGISVNAFSEQQVSELRSSLPRCDIFGYRVQGMFVLQEEFSDSSAD